MGPGIKFKSSLDSKYFYLIVSPASLIPDEFLKVLFHLFAVLSFQKQCILSSEWDRRREADKPEGKKEGSGGLGLWPGMRLSS